MSPVFAHGRLRLYLLRLLEEAPRHGYEVIRLLEERFHGLYAPSAGTVYPRLAKLEQEGLVTHSSEGGRKVYRITEAGRAELNIRQDELAELELEIRDSVSQLADAIREDVRDSAKDLREEMRRAAKESQHQQRATGKPGADGWEAAFGDQDAWQHTKDEYARHRAQAKEQARQAKEQAKRAREQAKVAREDARQVREHSHAARTAAQAEALRLKQRVEQQVREHAARGDWPTGLAEGLSELTRGLAGLADPAKWGAQPPSDRNAPAGAGEAAPSAKDGDPGTPGERDKADLPDWVRTDPAGDPVRELERLLDRFRDQVRDAARDHGVSAAQLEGAGTALATAADRLRALLRQR